MLYAHTHVRSMRGGAQGHMIRATDGHWYIVKALNNPQHPRILANEWLASSLAYSLGLSVPPFGIMDITEDFIAASPELVLRVGGSLVPMAPGFAFASRVPTPNLDVPIFDYLPEASLEQVDNFGEFAGILALDKWLCNCDGRQVIFCRSQSPTRFRAYFIDFGFCFNAGDWNFPDGPLRGVYPRNAVYRHVAGWESFEPWLSRIETFSRAKLHRLITNMPCEWSPNPKALAALLDCVFERRSKVRALIRTVRDSQRAPFEHWEREGITPEPQPALFSATART